MFTRLLTPQSGSFFLFGPRGTGKSTWIRANYRDAHLIDLLPARNYLKYQRDPSLLESEVLALPKNKMVVIDEIQKVPELTDEVHNLIENHEYRNFILTGSSARKLRHGASNLLAGRAKVRHLYPLTSFEIAFEFQEEKVLDFGLLPLSITQASDADRRDFLEAYLETYLAEEIKAEALVKNLGSFSRFLEIAALMAGTQVNLSNVSREVGISRETIRGYFDILSDTLIGDWLPAFQPRAKVKEVHAPKFYWFDPGVLNVTAGGFKQHLPDNWKGILLEHWIHHELKAYLAYKRTRGDLTFWGTPSKAEVDFVWSDGRDTVGIEVKSTSRMRSEFLSGLRSLSEGHPLKKSLIVYLGEDELRKEGVQILPVRTFLTRLWKGEII